MPRELSHHAAVIEKTQRLDIPQRVLHRVSQRHLPSRRPLGQLSTCLTTPTTPKSPAPKNGSPMVAPRSCRSAQTRRVVILLYVALTAELARPPPLKQPVCVYALTGASQKNKPV